MTQENRQLLLKDLSARLPYYPKCEMIDELRVVNNEKDPSYMSTLFPKHIELFSYHNNFAIKPYLRPMSSMTDEEHTYWDYVSSDSGWGITEGLISECVDWLNAHHFDYRGLIEKGLAIEVTEENNPYKK